VTVSLPSPSLLPPFSFPSPPFSLLPPFSLPSRCSIPYPIQRYKAKFLLVLALEEDNRREVPIFLLLGFPPFFLLFPLPSSLFPLSSFLFPLSSFLFPLPSSLLLFSLPSPSSLFPLPSLFPHSPPSSLTLVQ
jgi:hypothetical protein